MGKHIWGLYVESYRGIVDFSVDDLSSINIIVGANNCGKTSLLEAIQILNRPSDFGNIVMVSRLRDRFRMMPVRFTQSQYSSFINIFNKLQEKLMISLCWKTTDKDLELTLVGEVVESLVNEDQLAELKRVVIGSRLTPAIDEEVVSFFGKQTIKIDDMLHWENTLDVMLNKYSRVMRSGNEKALFPMSYLSPIDHAVVDRFNEITRIKNLRDDVIKILQSVFDYDIQDLRTIEEDDGRTVRMVEHRLLGDMPLSTYGDGIKKVIALANAAASVKNGILLVDEYETAIHPNAMDQVFKFLVNVCRNRNIQLFLTTHSYEALDKMLQCKEASDNIKVITMYKNSDRTTARVLSGEKALYVKDELGLELR
jgi:AAA15 family ATPase/GTPase